MTSVNTTSQISPAMERTYHQSALLGDWKGTWGNNSQPVEFKVVSIRGARAVVEYTHNGRTERGFGKVNGATISFANVTVGTKDGKQAILLFSAGGGKAAAYLDKQQPDTAQNNLVGSWSAYSAESGQGVSLRVLSVDGRDAKVRYTANGITQEGTGIVYKNVVMFGDAQISTDDGKSGKVTLRIRHDTYSIPATKVPTAGDSTVVDRLA